MNRLTKLFAFLSAIMLPIVSREATPQTLDVAEWNAARAVGSTEAYQAFLSRHPASPFAGEAFRSLVETTRIAENPGIFPDSYNGGSASFGEPQVAAALY